MILFKKIIILYIYSRMSHLTSVSDLRIFTESFIYNKRKSATSTWNELNFPFLTQPNRRKKISSPMSK